MKLLLKSEKGLRGVVWNVEKLSLVFIYNMWVVLDSRHGVLKCFKILFTIQN